MDTCFGPYEDCILDALCPHLQSVNYTSSFVARSTLAVFSKRLTRRYEIRELRGAHSLEAERHLRANLEALLKSHVRNNDQMQRIWSSIMGGHCQRYPACRLFDSGSESSTSIDIRRPGQTQYQKTNRTCQANPKHRARQNNLAEQTGAVEATFSSQKQTKNNVECCHGSF